MKFEILEFVDGAKKAKGVTVIIDVFRAFSVACYAFDAGAKMLIATGEVNKALELKKDYRDVALIGERDEKKIPGFDFGNSPTEITKADLKGKTVIQTTTAGTNGLANADNANILITGSLVNVGAIARFIKSLNPDQVSLVAMGYRAKESAEEDLLCARYIKSLLEGEEHDFSKEITDLRFTAGERFFKAENFKFSPPSDFFLCTMTNRFNFVLKAEKRSDGNINLERIDI